MATLQELEQRLAAVEQAVAELRNPPKASLGSSWLERITGIHQNDPAFDEVVRLGKEFRESQPYPGDAKSLADQLPPEIACQISPEWRKNEATYWSVRDQLFGEYEGQWIGFADGSVIASGRSPVAVFHKAEASSQHPFVTCVGKENEPIRMRRANFGYDASYPGEPLPVLSIEFRPLSGTPGIVLDRVIADTVADASAIPWVDCQRLQLDLTRGQPVQMSGVAGGQAMSLIFRICVLLDGQEYPCLLQADFVGHERILGRDVLNRLVAVFDGPSGEVVVNP